MFLNSASQSPSPPCALGMLSGATVNDLGLGMKSGSAFYFSHPYSCIEKKKVLQGQTYRETNGKISLTPPSSPIPSCHHYTTPSHVVSPFPPLHTNVKPKVMNLLSTYVVLGKQYHWHNNDGGKKETADSLNSIMMKEHSLGIFSLLKWHFLIFFKFVFFVSNSVRVSDSCGFMCDEDGRLFHMVTVSLYVIRKAPLCCLDQSNHNIS